MSSHSMNRHYIYPAFSHTRGFLGLAIVAVALISGLGACATGQSKQDEALMQTQMTRIDERVATIHKAVKIQADMAANVEQLERSVMALNGQVEEFNVRSGQLTAKMERLERSVADLGRETQKRSSGVSPDIGPRLAKIDEELGRLSRETAALSSFVRKQGKMEDVVAKPAEKRLEPGELYQLSYNSYLRADYDAAMSGFRKYLELYPKTDLSDNAAYWIGEAYVSKKEYVKAAKAFDVMAKNYPTSNKAPTALLKSADSFLKVDDKGAAVTRLKILVDKYTSSNEAITASDRLSSLGVRYPAQ